MAQVNGNAPKITLYTNHRCPYAHRAHIVLKELGLPYEEVIIDLDKPREQWYLDINPRGLVPAIKFNGDIITESSIVATFLADAYPSHLFPASGTPENALVRARINFFVDTWNTKVGTFFFKILMSDSDEEKAKTSNEFVEIITKEIEPLLKDAKPFFGGSDKLTLAEALTAPWIVRMYGMSTRGVLPQSIAAGLDKLPSFSKWAKLMYEQESVTYIYDEEAIVNSTLSKIKALKEKAKAAP